MVLFLIACSAPPTSSEPIDAASDVGCGCDDGLYCNGVETCVADGGCLLGSAPCADGCDEAMDRCTTTGCPDADGDGETEAACGGRDCDDADPAVHVGATEICDPSGVDEDCDPSTFGVRDQDGDGFPDARCCNGTTCGIDCDDSLPAVHFGAVEVCDLLDEDCDGAIDEGVLALFYPDADGDGYGASDGVPISACAPPSGTALDRTDCDDTAGRGATIHPGATEDCASAADDDCDGAVNEGCGCPTVGGSRACGSAAALAQIGDCRPGTQTCMSIGGGSTAWGACTGAVEPASEQCGGGDEDCDGMTNESDAVDAIGCWADADLDGYRATGAARTSACTCAAGTTSRDTPYDCDDDASTGASVHPGAAETCNHADDDCDGTTDRGVGTSCSFARTLSGTTDATHWSCSHRAGTTTATSCSAAPFTRSGVFGHLTTEATTTASASAIRLPQDVDLTRDVQVSADFVLQRDTARNGSISVWLAPSGGSHAPTAQATASVGGAPAERDTLAATWDFATSTVQLWQHDGTRWNVLSTGQPATSSTCTISALSSSAPNVRTLTLLLTGAIVSARLSCGSTSVESAATKIFDAATFYATYYDGPSYPHFHVGLGAASAGSLRARTTAVSLRRAPTGASSAYPACVPCRDYGVAGLSY